MSRFRFAFLSLLPVLLLAFPADALELCVKVDKNGAPKDGAPIRLRAACKQKKSGDPIEVSIGTTTQLSLGAALEKYLSVDTTENIVRFEGANVQIRSGQGSSEGEGDRYAPTVNGLGNLIIGYDEPDEHYPDKTGSHNLVIGPYHSYTSAGALLAGVGNVASGPWVALAGGEENEAHEFASAVVGGVFNNATEELSVVVGGWRNEASGTGAVVVSGEENVASGGQSVAGGGKPS